jgi:hypothetical protein
MQLLQSIIINSEYGIKDTNTSVRSLSVHSLRSLTIYLYHAKHPKIDDEMSKTKILNRITLNICWDRLHKLCGIAIVLCW